MRGGEEGKGAQITEGDLIFGGEHTVRYTDEILQTYSPGTYIILLNDITPIKIKRTKTRKKII